VIFELPEKDFQKIGHLLNGVSHYIVLAKLLDGKTPGRIWVNCLDEPTTALVWDRLNAFFYLAGNSSDPELNHEMHSLIVDTIFPTLIELQYRHFFLQVTPQKWEAQLEVILGNLAPEKNFITCYILKPTRVKTVLNDLVLPAGYELRKIPNVVQSNTQLKNMTEVVSCIQACWKSVEQYLNNGGIGYCLLEDKVVTSWCSTDYIVGNQCELYVETFKGYRRKGFGLLAASACVKECIARGYAVFWHCFRDNLGSVRIAEKLGFEKEAEAPIYTLSLKGSKEQYRPTPAPPDAPPVAPAGDPSRFAALCLHLYSHE
jgi:GNAT superfamily N-acetyltransferase